MKLISLWKVFFYMIVVFTSFSAHAENGVMPDLIPPGAKPKITFIKPLTSSIKPNISLIKNDASLISSNASKVRDAVDEILKKDSNIALSESVTEIRLQLSSDILFDFDKWNIRSSAEQTLKYIGEIISKYPKSKTVFEGHTDSKGDDNYNLKLSNKRANSVQNWLVNNSSISSASLRTVGYGEKKPVAPNTLPNGQDNPEGRQRNRRVEIVIQK